MITAICIIGLALLILGAAASKQPELMTHEEMVKKNEERANRVTGCLFSVIALLMLLGIIISFFD
ncbi:MULTISPECIES: hypothetical protein [Butyricimonas]|uniref:hypothetical protein n=1 Tax=Butyricimonas TaxID=574697 RepID=UPI0007FB4035|nr:MULTISPECIES: hypothetical protein [Butyricimonas]